MNNFLFVTTFINVIGDLTLIEYGNIRIYTEYK